METYIEHSKPHIGRNIATLRKLKGIKQEVLAKEIGISQSQISEIENADTIEDGLLLKIAQGLHVSIEDTKSFDPISAFYSINNTLENVEIKDTAQGIHQVFNPIEKVVELYERLLASEREKLELFKEIQK